MHVYHVCDGHGILRIWKLPRLARTLVQDAEHGLPVLRAVRGGVVQDVGEGGEKGISQKYCQFVFCWTLNDN